MADSPHASAEQIRAIWEELDRPGPEKLQVALRKRGFFAPSVKVLREHFFKYQSSRQVFRNPPKYTGHIYSEGLDRRWVADVMVMPEVEYGGKSYKYALVVMDVFSRFAWAALIDSPMTAAAGYKGDSEEGRKAPQPAAHGRRPWLPDPRVQEGSGEHDPQSQNRPRGPLRGGQVYRLSEA